MAYLDGDERSQLLAAAEEHSPHLRDVVIFAMLTGTRLSEILALTWGDVDLARRIVTFRKTKSGKVHHVPVNPDLYAVLMRLEPAADPATPLFPPEWNGRRVTTAFRRAAQRAGLKAFRSQDLRHDFGSWLTMRGVPLRAVQTLLDYADLRMTERYAHPAEQALPAAVQVLPPVPASKRERPRDSRSSGGPPHPHKGEPGSSILKVHMIQPSHLYCTRA